MVRVTLVCGIRKSGKSTLVGGLLQACDGLRVCAVVDDVKALEFSDLGTSFALLLFNFTRKRSFRRTSAVFSFF